MGTSTQTGERTVSVLYCDIDGTIRKGKSELGHFVNVASEVEVFPQVPALLAGYKRAGWRIIGISNQGGIALGLVTMQECLKAMAETHRQCQALFDKILFCSHHPDAEDPEMARCWCRKPRAGLIFEAAYELAGKYPGEIYPPHKALFVGDRREDQMCADAANIDFMDASLWRTGRHLENLGR